MNWCLSTRGLTELMGWYLKMTGREERTLSSLGYKALRSHITAQHPYQRYFTIDSSLISRLSAGRLNLANQNPTLYTF